MEFFPRVFPINALSAEKDDFEMNYSFKHDMRGIMGILDSLLCTTAHLLRETMEASDSTYLGESIAVRIGADSVNFGNNRPSGLLCAICRSE
jgi:hypothetical protein